MSLRSKLLKAAARKYRIRRGAGLAKKNPRWMDLPERHRDKVPFDVAGNQTLASIKAELRKRSRRADLAGRREEAASLWRTAEELGSSLKGKGGSTIYTHKPARSRWAPGLAGRRQRRKAGVKDWNRDD